MIEDFTFDTWFISIYGRNREPQFKEDMRLAFHAGCKAQEFENRLNAEEMAALEEGLTECSTDTK